MAPVAFADFAAATQRIRLLFETATDKRLRPRSYAQTQVVLHACLAGYVGAWEAYIEQLTRDFFDASARPLSPTFHATHTLLRQRAEVEVKLFNTPNAENCRTLLLSYTGFDPWPCWLWPARKMNSVQVRERLAEILKVRHSFAHGFSMPKFAWNTSPTGRVGLNSRSITDTEAFFRNLVTRTDEGMRLHLEAVYSTAGS